MTKLFMLLPSLPRKPAGGFKVVFEYANRFAAVGYNVVVIYPAVLDTENLTGIEKIRRFLITFCARMVTKTYSCKSWFNLDPAVKELLVYRFNKKIFNSLTDIVIATAAETAVFLMQTENIKAKKLFYLIQGYEKWVCDGNEELLIKTWKADFKKIVIAPWLLEIAQKLGQSAELIENGFNFDYFKLTNPIEKRTIGEKVYISLLYHAAENKGFIYAFEALKIIKEKFQNLGCLVFGTPKRLKMLPGWCEYYSNPDKETHNMIYNSAAIFVAPSLSEGFGLTPGEAMQCGCAVVAADNGGHRVFCKHNETALVCEPANTLSLAESIIELLANDTLRMSIAKNGHEFIKQFTWDRAFRKFKAYIEQ